MRQHTEQFVDHTQLYQTIFDAASDGLVVFMPSGRLVQANRAAHVLYGSTALIERTWAELFDPQVAPMLDDVVAAVTEHGEFVAQTRGLNQTGQCFALDVRITALDDPARPQLLATLRAIPSADLNYHALEQRVAERTRELTTLLDVSHTLAATLELNTLLGVILEQLQAIVSYGAAAVFLLEGTDTLRLLRYQGPIPQHQLARNWSLQEAGHSRAVIYSRQPLIIPDVRADTPMAQAFRAKAMLDLQTIPAYIASWMGVPLMLRKQVIGVLAFDHGEVGYYTAHHAELALAFANHAALAIENAHLFGQAQGIAALLERQRLARELHDSVSQVLYGIAMGARTARTLLERDPSQAAAPLDYVLSLAEAGMAEMRALIFELRPESLETEGIIAALQKQVTSLRTRYNLEVSTDLCAEPDVSLAIKEALYRVAQEALHNTVKHARAKHVSVRLATTDDQLHLELSDDGQGFDPTGPFPGHLGLESMRERIARLGGTFTLESTSGKGTTIRVVINCCQRDGN